MKIFLKISIYVKCTVPKTFILTSNGDFNSISYDIL